MRSQLNIAKTLAILASIAFAILAFITTLNGLSLKLFQKGFSGLYEITEIAIALFIFMFLPLSILNQKHICFTFLEHRSPFLKRLNALFHQGLFLSFACLLLYGFWNSTRNAFLPFMIEKTPILGIHLGYIYGAITCLMAIMIILILWRLRHILMKPEIDNKQNQ